MSIDQNHSINKSRLISLNTFVALGTCKNRKVHNRDSIDGKKTMNNADSCNKNNTGDHNSIKSALKNTLCCDGLISRFFPSKKAQAINKEGQDNLSSININEGNSKTLDNIPGVTLCEGLKDTKKKEDKKYLNNGKERTNVTINDNSIFSNDGFRYRYAQICSKINSDFDSMKNIIENRYHNSKRLDDFDKEIKEILGNIYKYESIKCKMQNGKSKSKFNPYMIISKLIHNRLCNKLKKINDKIYTQLYKLHNNNYCREFTHITDSHCPLERSLESLIHEINNRYG